MLVAAAGARRGPAARRAPEPAVHRRRGGRRRVRRAPRRGDRPARGRRRRHRRARRHRGATSTGCTSSAAASRACALVARADQGHSSLADELGFRNAGVDAARAVVAVRDELEPEAPPNEHGLRGWHATVNTGLAYRGGVGYGVLPGRVAVDTEVRLLPGMERAAVAGAFERTLRAVAGRTGAALELAFDEPPNDWLPATLVEPQHPLAATAERRLRGGARPRARRRRCSPAPPTRRGSRSCRARRRCRRSARGCCAARMPPTSGCRSPRCSRAVDLYAELARRFCEAAA